MDVLGAALVRVLRLTLYKAPLRSPLGGRMVPPSVPIPNGSQECVCLSLEGSLVTKMELDMSVNAVYEEVTGTQSAPWAK